jgi:hypothetical protein
VLWKAYPLIDLSRGTLEQERTARLAFLFHAHLAKSAPGEHRTDAGADKKYEMQARHPSAHRLF